MRVKSRDSFDAPSPSPPPTPSPSSSSGSNCRGQRFIIDRIFLPLLLLYHYSQHYHGTSRRNATHSRVSECVCERGRCAHSRIAERSDKRRSRARLYRSFPAISCVTCRHRRRCVGWILTFMSRSTRAFHGGRTYQRVSRMPLARPTPVGHPRRDERSPRSRAWAFYRCKRPFTRDSNCRPACCRFLIALASIPARRP